MKSKCPVYVGTIKVNDLILNRKGRPNAGQNPELRPKVHESKKAYKRKKRFGLDDY